MSSESLTITRSTWECICSLPDDERLCFFDALMNESFGTPVIVEQQSGHERLFDDFRRAYPGSKRGFRVEFENFKKKYPKEWRRIIPLLKPALERLLTWRAAATAAGQFVPCFKNLSTWINNQCWTEEFPQIPSPQSIVQPKATEAQRPAKNDIDEDPDELRRKRYERRVPCAFTDEAPITLFQYSIMGYDNMTDEDFESELRSIVNKEKVIPKTALEFLRTKK